MENINTFGEKLKQARTAKKMSQTKLAQKLYVTAPTVCRYENDQVLPPLDVTKRIAAILNVSLDWLCGGDTSEKVSLHGLTDKQKESVKGLIEDLKQNKLSI